MTTVHPETRYRVGTADDIPEGGRQVVDVGETTVGVFRFRGKLYAYENRCAHSGGPVCQGRLVHRVREVLDEGGRSSGQRFDPDHLHIVCPWHGFEFDVETGAHPGQAHVRLRPLKVEEEGDEVYVSV